jgi:ribosomal RNA-processing protein 12
MANAFKKTEDGRLVVSEPADQDASSSEDEEMEASAVDKTDYYLESKQSREGYTRVNNRIKFNKQGLDAEAFVNESDDEETAKKSRNKKKPRPLPMIGQAYRSKKAGGDVKRPGKPDPYAYIPLNPMTLKKRGPRAKLAVRITGRGHAKRR